MDDHRRDCRRRPHQPGWHPRSPHPRRWRLASNGFTIEIRYSSTHAAWARATASPDTDALLEAEITGWPCNVGGGKQSGGTTEDYSTDYWQIWSNMVGLTYLQACTNHNVADSTSRLCTSLVVA